MTLLLPTIRISDVIDGSASAISTSATNVDRIGLVAVAGRAFIGRLDLGIAVGGADCVGQAASVRECDIGGVCYRRQQQEANKERQ